MAPSPTPVDKNVAIVRTTILQTVQELHMGLEEATKYVTEAMHMPPDLASVAYELLDQERRSIMAMGSAVVDPKTYGDGGWYLGSLKGGHWERYSDLLRSKNATGLNELDEETRRIVGLLADPNRRGQKRKGLVMGNVQSGKTRNFAGVAAKAADAGYRFVIVLSGLHNNLRSQTQARLDSQLFLEDGWYPLTSVDEDFHPVPKPQELLLHQPLLCVVVKKNTKRLQSLVEMMRDIPSDIRRERPVLIIDDEADQATPNSLKQQRKISAINRRLKALWSTVVTGTYVGYTATPFANVLMDPDDESDLFPSDFITTIEPGEGYFGAERVFGVSDTVDVEGEPAQGLDMVRLISSDDSGALRPPSDSDARLAFDPDLPSSLSDALAWFVVATAIRRARQQQAHSSMLIHTTHYTAPHWALKKRLDGVLALQRAAVRDGRFDPFHDAWTAEARRVKPEAIAPLPSWDEVRNWIPIVLTDAEVIVDNGSSEDRLNYVDGTWRTVIAVGGGTLSRGLTLEGLVVSYFTRTSNAYDTLMQMGRWFGYRQGYEDLPRVWVTKGLDQDYAFLARVEKDLREEIQSVQGSEFSPAQVGVRVRAHPGRLQITAANKMVCAQVVQLGLSGTANQTFILDGSSKSIVDNNVSAVEQLVSDFVISEVPWSPSRYWVRDVPGLRVCAFLENFKIHGDQAWLVDRENRHGMKEWVETWANGPSWNVVLFGNSQEFAPDKRTRLGTLQIAGIDLACLNRSAMSTSTPNRIDLKAIMSPSDRVCDIAPGVFDRLPHSTDVDRRRIRRAHGDGKGLIVIYPISANSKAAPASTERVDMPASHHQVGFSIFFPNINDSDGKEGAFVSVRRTWEVPDTVEGEDTTEDEEEATSE